MPYQIRGPSCQEMGSEYLVTPNPAVSIFTLTILQFTTLIYIVCLLSTYVTALISNILLQFLSFFNGLIYNFFSCLYKSRFQSQQMLQLKLMMNVLPADPYFFTYSLYFNWLNLVSSSPNTLTGNKTPSLRNFSRTSLCIFTF